jgi:NAD+ synthase
MVSSTTKGISFDDLLIPDINSKVNSIVNKINTDITIKLKRKGAVVGLSGGIDSSVTLALTVKALGSDNVLGVLMPEKDSSADSKKLAIQLANQFNVKTIESDITSALEGFGCYAERDAAVNNIFPEYDPLNYTMKIGINSAGINKNIPTLFYLTIVDKNDNSKSKILPLKEYLQIQAEYKRRQAEAEAAAAAAAGPKSPKGSKSPKGPKSPKGSEGSGRGGGRTRRRTSSGTYRRRPNRARSSRRSRARK